MQGQAYLSFQGSRKGQDVLSCDTIKRCVALNPCSHPVKDAVSKGKAVRDNSCGSLGAVGT